MSSYISDALRQSVASRADYLCEYCLIHDDDTFLGCEVDHIISLKHGGSTEAENLAYACCFCNRHKGSDIASIVKETGNLARFFNPRLDRWAEHFHFSGNIIEPLTDVGEATARIFGFNASERILERESLIAIGHYPSKSALTRIQG